MSLPTPTPGEIIDGAHVYPVRVHYENTDAGGIVYHTDYLNFCERARTECFRLLVGSLRALEEKQNLLIVVKTMAVEYHTPARFDDALVVRTLFHSAKGATFQMTQEIWRPADQKKCLTLSVNLVTINSSGNGSKTGTGKPVRVPDLIKDKLKTISIKSGSRPE